MLMMPIRRLLIAAMLGACSLAATPPVAFAQSLPSIEQLESLLSAPPQASAPGASAWGSNNNGLEKAGPVRLVSALRSIGPETATIDLGLEFALDPGWKIYWRSVSYPTQLVWEGSDNLAQAEIHWPVPHRSVFQGIESLGYDGTITLPVTATLARPGEPVRLKLNLDFLSCATQCVPQRMDLSLDLPSGPAEPSAFAHSLNRARAHVPEPGPAQNLRLVTAETFGSGDQAVVRAVVESDTAFAAPPELFVFDATGTEFQQAELRFEQDGSRAVLEAMVQPKSNRQDSLTDRPLDIVVADGQRAVEFAVSPGTGSAFAIAWGEVLGIMAVALLGGLILNAMPCVLPVLSIKILGLVGHGGGERRHIRAGFIASAAGIVTAFLVLAAIAIGLKQAGMAIGWGIQFQQPLFLGFMAVLVTLFAANLWGLFEIPLPAFMSNAGSGQGTSPTGPLAGHFANGVFATLLATPCSAPFLGTAIGFALARGPVEIGLVFAALGLGMALPYLLIAVFPGLALRMPRPGRWMVTLRRVMGGLLALTAAWLVSVLWVQIGSTGALIIAATLAAIIALLALRLRTSDRLRPAVLAGIAVLAGFAFAAPAQLAAGRQDSAQTEAASALSPPWTGFDRAAIPGLVGQGKVVFVDVTADWCITCKVNKKAVLDREAMENRLGAPDVVAMRADWTRPDQSITAYLASFSRYGIPFNAVYGPGAPGGIPLPEILTESAVLAALAQAGKVPND